MLVRRADPLHWQDRDVERLRQAGEDAIHHRVGDDRVGAERQMRPVLLDRRQRHHGDGTRQRRSERGEILAGVLLVASGERRHGGSSW
jgi:hypothetical protein